MKRNQKRILSIAIILGVILLVLGYMKFFNGTFIYLSTGMKNNELMKVSGNVTYTFEADILMSDAKEQYESVFGNDVWSQKINGTDFSEYAKDQIKSKLMRIGCMNEMAKEKGVALSRDEKEAVSNEVDDYMAGLTESQIEKLKITKEKLTDMYTDFAIAQRLYDDMVSVMNIEISADDARVIDIQYICTESKSDIEAAKDELSQGKSFYTIATKYNSDDKYEYELKRGEMDKVFEMAAFNLKSGETSDIVDVNGKYYIIKCTSDNDKVKTEVNKTTLLEQKQLEQFNQTFEKYESGIYIEWNDSQWEKMSLSSNEIYSVNFEEIFNKYLK